MHRIAATAMLLLPLFAFAQRAKPPVFVPLKPPPITRHPPVPQMQKGSVEGRTYKNDSIGLELKVADGLEFQAPELKGTPGAVPLLVTVTAWRSEGVLSPRTATAFYADALVYYPETQRSTDAYMRKVIRGNRETGYEPVKENLKTDFGGMSFARTDFRGPLYEAVLVKACEAQAFVFIFASSNKDKVDALVATTSVKFDPVRSGCRHPTSAN